MANAMIPLQNVTLGSSASTVTFSSIPGTYRDLRLVISTRSTFTTNTQEAMYVQFNSDTGANYSDVTMAGSGSTTTSYTDTQARIGRPDTSSAGNTSMGVITVDLLDYSATDKHKSYLSRWNAQNSDYGIGAHAGRWASTSAITSMSTYLVQSGAQFAAGSTFSLYGIVSA